MKKVSLSVLVLLIPVLNVFAQSDTNLRETAKSFLMQGDYNNAIVVLNRALETDKNNLELLKDLAFTHYLQRDFAKAMQVAKPFADREDADVQSFQILGMIYNAIEEKKDAEKMYKTAFKKFPSSGVLHNEYGELLWSKKEFREAIRYWEKGIELEPGFAGNYYNAAKYYYFSEEKVWGLVYGEIFINLESYTKRTPEIKTILLDGYKKLFADSDLTKNQNTKNEFVAAFLGTMNNHSKVVSTGITPESLSALRTRFILDWQEKNALKFPFKLFEYQQQLLKEGIFEAYNQWIFGSAKDLAAYQNWTSTHSEQYSKFKYFQENRVFKVPPAQYYQVKGK